MLKESPSRRFFEGKTSFLIWRVRLGMHNMQCHVVKPNALACFDLLK